MNQQREQAVFERHERIKAAAKTLYSVTVRYEHILISATVERLQRGQDTLDLNNIKETIYKFLNDGITDGSDFEDIINQLYDLLATVYQDRDIRIVLIDTNTSFIVERSFNTHQPLQQLAF